MSDGRHDASAPSAPEMDDVESLHRSAFTESMEETESGPETEELIEDRNWNEEFQAILTMPVTTDQERLARDAAAHKYVLNTRYASGG